MLQNYLLTGHVNSIKSIIFLVILDDTTFFQPSFSTWVTFCWVNVIVPKFSAHFRTHMVSYIVTQSLPTFWNGNIKWCVCILCTYFLYILNCCILNLKAKNLDTLNNWLWWSHMSIIQPGARSQAYHRSKILVTDLTHQLHVQGLSVTFLIHVLDVYYLMQCLNHPLGEESQRAEYK